MALKLEIVIVLTFSAIISISISSAHRVCTLDDMRLLAAEACEHIFQNTGVHSQHKRDVSNNEVPNDNSNVSNHDIHSHEHSKVRIHRRDYPKGGYLLINSHHAKILHRMGHDPEYRIMPLRSYQKKLLENSNSTEGARGKRENSEQYINVPYCCVNKCRMDYFCRS